MARFVSLMMAIKRHIADFHEKKSPGWLNLLTPLAWVYGLAVTIRLALYRLGGLRTAQPEVPIISVGNLTTGGTGKTPIVIEIARGLIRAGKTVVILSRGYGAAHPLQYGRALDPAYGDEAYMIQEQVPEAAVIVGKNRLRALKRAIRDYRPDYVLLDDGYQYLKLGRTMNILLIDGSRLIGNGRLLPVGPLREPLDQIRRADLIFLTREVSTKSMRIVEDWIRKHNRDTPIPIVPVPFQVTGLHSVAEQRADRPKAAHVGDVRTSSAIAFSGIAQPDCFENDLRGQGLRVLHHERFDDHHVYREQDMERILALLQHYRAENPILVTTDKDLPKVRHLIPEDFHDRLYILQIRPALDGRWFYDEFLTQMADTSRSGDRAHSSRHVR